jgi:hypothetical protein
MAQVSEVAIVVMLALIVFHLAVGWKIYRLSRGPGVVPASAATVPG